MSTSGGGWTVCFNYLLFYKLGRGNVFWLIIGFWIKSISINVIYDVSFWNDKYNVAVRHICKSVNTELSEKCATFLRQKNCTLYLNYT